ncbi:hypothetical protein F5Y19DRAFT_480077 [Xylariaceae sp. FL1651]|nr:hypothetical protein F5Y19DRAFT_480077 [Xylariaceae sp. FL1651]
MPQFSFSATGVEVVNAFADQVHNKTILITGPSENGVGAETAISLAHANPMYIILAGRTEAKVESVIQKIHNLNPSIQVKFVKLDLSYQASVRRAAALILDIAEKIDIIINNAAIMACPWSKTRDGIESQFATNYLGHFLLTNLLLDKMVKGGSIRIINTTSTGGMGGDINFDDINYKDGKTYVPVAAYAQSKAAMMLFSVALASRFDPQIVTAFSVHPGIHLHDADTLKSAIEWVTAKTGQFVREEFKTLQQGCSTTLVAALDPSIIESSGCYLANAQIALPQPLGSCTDREVADTLWSISEGLVHQEFEWKEQQA